MAAIFTRRLFAPFLNHNFATPEKLVYVNCICRTLRTVNTDRNSSQANLDLVYEERQSEEELRRVNTFFDRVNEYIEKNKNDRHFAVIHMYGKQHLVKEGDVFIARKQIPASVGDRIKIEKVMLLGNENVTLIGKPLLNRDLVHVEATVIEKTMSHTYTYSIVKKRGWRRWFFYRVPLTMLRINEVKICHKLNESQSVIQ